MHIFLIQIKSLEIQIKPIIFQKIKYLNVIWLEYQSLSQGETIINFINKCTYIEDILFYELAEESLINILKNINCLKLKKLTVI